MTATLNRFKAGALTRLLVAVMAIVAGPVFAAPVTAAILVVDRADDASVDGCTIAAGDCTLRGAITKANTDAAADTINFDGTQAILIDDPLPTPVEPLAIDAQATGSSVAGSTGVSSYESDYCIALGADYAVDLTDPAATIATVRSLPFFGVCDRAIKSTLSPPTITIGPRKANGSLPVRGTGTGTVDLFRSPGTVGEYEADNFFAAVAASGGFTYVPPVELTPGAALNATITSPAMTSSLSRRVPVPTDISSPVLTNAVAVSNARVRLDFNEQIAPGSLAPANFGLGMANQERTITATSWAGNSVFLDAIPAWNTGEAGTTLLTGGGPVTDAVSNEVIGAPGTSVFSGPGEIEAPVISSFRFQPNRFCKTKTARCKREKTSVYMTLNKSCRVIFTVMRGAKKLRPLVSFVRRLDAGRNKFKLGASISGRRLPASTMTLRAVAEDVSRTRSIATDTLFRVVTDRKFL